MPDRWDEAMDELFPRAGIAPRSQVPVPFSSAIREREQCVSRLRDVHKVAMEMATLPEYANILIAELHRQLQQRFADVPARVCSELLKYVLDPRN